MSDKAAKVISYSSWVGSFLFHLEIILRVVKLLVAS
jgi:hypothetical protein